MTQNERRTSFIAQRDKHLEQFMAINARSVFVVLALVVSILVGFDKIETLNVPKHDGPIAAAVFCLGAILLTISSVIISLFHTKQIRSLEAKSWSVVDLTDEDLRVIPKEGWKNPFPYTLLGVICVIVAILILLKHKFV